MASYAKGFRSPTFNESYGPAFWGSNPNLKPESAYLGELANVFTYKNISLTQTAYYNKIKDLNKQSSSTLGLLNLVILAHLKANL